MVPFEHCLISQKIRYYASIYSRLDKIDNKGQSKEKSLCGV